MSFEAFAAKFLLNDYRGICRASGLSIHFVPPRVLGLLVRKIHAGVIPRAQAKQILKEWALCATP